MSVYPGEEIKNCSECLIGHGAYTDKDEEGNTVSIASVQGEPQRIDRLITVQAKTLWYTPGIGDIVVGRITGVSNKRWYVDINTTTETVLMLTAINLIGNVQRRKGELDEIMMKEYYQTGDIIIAEVQSTGIKTQLHTRNERYRKIPFGILLTFPPEAVAKSRTQHITLEVDGKEITATVGINGYVAVYGNSDTSAEIKKVATHIASLPRTSKISEATVLAPFQPLPSKSGN
ncbi:exosome complex component RRP4 [Nematocida displodere]|uniref:Exosome complex component RRP4 n=1 Tax=Nematocida displodere TaxID=1805483 RepID=A0A177ECW4_9MICR|nr:exosome complex component RRP4 [Nematocida displodere]